MEPKGSFYIKNKNIGGMNMLYQMDYQPEMQISLSKGNRKLGKKVFAFNLLPGDKPISTKDKGQLTNVSGTCGGCCEECEGNCYAVRDARYHHNSCIPALAKNTLIMRHNMEGTFTQLRDRLKSEKAKILRYHSSGEIEIYDYLLHMVKLAIEMPEVRFYFYTKRFDFMEKYLKECGELPENLICNISEWKGNTKGYNLDGLNRIVYDDGTDESLKNIPHCPAVNKKGHKTGVTCDQCGLCFSGNNGHVVAVYEH